MARELQHTIKISGDNKKLKSIMRESDQILRGSTRVTETYTKLLRNQLEMANKKLDELGRNLKSFDQIKSFKEQASQVKNLRMELEQISKTGRVPGVGGGGPGGPSRLLTGGRGMWGMMRSMPMIGPLLGLAGMSAFATQAFGQRAALAGVGVQSRALGGRGFRARGAYGFGGAATTQQALSLTQTIGNEGGLEDLQALSRATGVGVDQLTGAAGVMRRAGNAPGQSIAAVRKTMSILSDTLGKTLDKGRIGEYLQSIDQSTTQFSQMGKVNTEALTRTFAGLMKTPGFAASPQRAGAAISAIDATMRQSTGARFGFMSSVMAEALGPKNDNPVNRMFELGLGAFGQGGQLGNQRMPKVFGAMRRRMQGMNMNEQTGSLFLNRQFGLGVGTSQDLFKAIMSGNMEKIKEIGAGKKSPEEYRSKALQIMESTDGNIIKMKSGIEALQLSMGDNLGETVSSIYKLLGGVPLSAAEKQKDLDMQGRQLEKRHALRLSSRLRVNENAEDISKYELMGMNRIGGTGVFNQKEAETMIGNLSVEKQQLQSRIEKATGEEKQKLIDVLKLVEAALKTFKAQVEVTVKGRGATAKPAVGRRNG